VFRLATKPATKLPFGEHFELCQPLTRQGRAAGGDQELREEVLLRLPALSRPRTGSSLKPDGWYLP